MNWTDKITKDTFSVQKTARIFTYGNANTNTEHAWLLFHGYGQLASGLLKHFTELDREKHFVVAPEGMSRFYVDGVYGKVGASWMTKEDRKLEIADQLLYLDKVNSQYFSKLRGREIKIHVLGFSQGVATLTRWMARDPMEVDSIIYWAGSVPVDEIPKESKAYANANIYCLAGDRDEYISENQFEEMTGKIEDRLDKKIQSIKYEGKHRIKKEPLEKLVRAIERNG